MTRKEMIDKLLELHTKIRADAANPFRHSYTDRKNMKAMLAEKEELIQKIIED